MIKKAINNIPTLKNTNNHIFRCTNESHLEWLLHIESLSKEEWDRDSLTKECIHTLKGIKDQITHIFYWLKTYLKNLMNH